MSGGKEWYTDLSSLLNHSLVFLTLNQPSHPLCCIRLPFFSELSLREEAPESVDKSGINIDSATSLALSAAVDSVIGL
jgi:hypothetical protein